MKDLYHHLYHHLMRRRLPAWLLAAGLCAGTQAPAQVWTPDRGDGTFVNPVIHADYSDPDVCAAPGGGFYMTASSFQCAPGLPILHSRDLVNWRLAGHALPAVPPEDYYGAAPRHGRGVWAPSIRYHAGEFFIYWGDPDFGIFMVKTRHPEGAWEKPVLVKAGKGMIDPCPLWDDDGRLYLAHAWAGSQGPPVLLLYHVNYLIVRLRPKRAPAAPDAGAAGFGAGQGGKYTPAGRLSPNFRGTF